uniref:Uncharacterized protein n=1 Tax=Cacopsylla melanoneura TaxID=428564 RepID=A0A8D8XST1_9HEMI
MTLSTLTDEDNKLQTTILVCPGYDSQYSTPLSLVNKKTSPRHLYQQHTVLTHYTKFQASTYVCILNTYTQTLENTFTAFTTIVQHNIKCIIFAQWARKKKALQFIHSCIVG